MVSEFSRSCFGNARSACEIPAQVMMPPRGWPVRFAKETAVVIEAAIEGVEETSVKLKPRLLLKDASEEVLGGGFRSRMTTEAPCERR